MSAIKNMWRVELKEYVMSAVKEIQWDIENIVIISIKHLEIN